MYKRREIVIELTALLDVILIILFMFIVRSNDQVIGKIDETKQIESLKEENNHLKTKITSESILNDACLMVTITVESADDNKNRKINIVTNTDKDKVEVEYNWDKITYAKNKLKDTLKNLSKDVGEDNQILLLVFQYNKDKIYMADYKLVDSVLKEIREDKNNVYLAYYDKSEKNEDENTNKKEDEK